jgi:hypothetical protein
MSFFIHVSILILKFLFLYSTTLVNLNVLPKSLKYDLLVRSFTLP